MIYEKVLAPLPADAPGPMYVIMDLQGIEKQFHRQIKQMKDHEGSLTEVLELLPGYINERRCATDGLEAYLERIVNDHEHSGSRQDGELLAAAVRVVGMHLIEQFRRLGMYHTDGLCHYLFEKWIDRQSPIFVKVRTEDLYDNPYPRPTR